MKTLLSKLRTEIIEDYLERFEEKNGKLKKREVETYNEKNFEIKQDYKKKSRCLEMTY